MYHITPDIDGGGDDTDAVRDMLHEMQTKNLPGFLNGVYRVREGELEWAQRGPYHVPGPVLATMPGTTLIPLGVRDAPILTLRNETPMRYIVGGSIGPLNFSDRYGQTTNGRHGIRMHGVEKMSFGHLFGLYLAGDVVRIARGWDDPDDPNGDPWHVFDCKFEGMEIKRGTGWALNNDAPNQSFNASQIGMLRAMHSRKGLWRGIGAGIHLRGASTAGCGGWAFDFSVMHGAPSRSRIFSAEIDAPEYGIHLSGAWDVKMEGIRINHRIHESELATKETVAWPKTAIKLGEDEAVRKANPRKASLVRDIEIEVHHRLGPHKTPLTMDTIGTLLDLSSDPGVADVKIRTRLIDGHKPLLPITDAMLATNAHVASSGLQIMRDSQVVA